MELNTKFNIGQTVFTPNSDHQKIQTTKIIGIRVCICEIGNERKTVNEEYVTEEIKYFDSEGKCIHPFINKKELFETQVDCQHIYPHLQIK